MQESKQVVVIVTVVGVVMIACLATTSLLAPHVSPVAMVAVIGGIIVAVLALALNRKFHLRFKVEKSGAASGQFGSKK